VQPARRVRSLKEFRKEAAAKGLTPRTLSLLDTVTLDQSVLAADKRRGVFKLSFEEFATPRISQRWNRASSTWSSRRRRCAGSRRNLACPAR
jgi:membrane-bound lytic murein transglycosylase B